MGIEKSAEMRFGVLLNDWTLKGLPLYEYNAHEGFLQTLKRMCIVQLFSQVVKKFLFFQKRRFFPPPRKCVSWGWGWEASAEASLRKYFVCVIFCYWLIFLGFCMSAGRLLRPVCATIFFFPFFLCLSWEAAEASLRNYNSQHTFSSQKMQVLNYTLS